MIVWDKDKDNTKDKLINKMVEYLKTLDKPPENKSINELIPIIEQLPKEKLVSVAGVSFDEN
jgi:vacuolar-type H+-ATPase subunit E/Vma4